MTEALILSPEDVEKLRKALRALEGELKALPPPPQHGWRTHAVIYTNVMIMRSVLTPGAADPNPN